MEFREISDISGKTVKLLINNVSVYYYLVKLKNKKTPEYEYISLDPPVCYPNSFRSQPFKIDFCYYSSLAFNWYLYLKFIFLCYYLYLNFVF